MELIIILFFYLIHLFHIYKVDLKIKTNVIQFFQAERCYREEFLVKYELERETRNMNGLLSILVPKFVKALMNQGNF